MAFSLEHFKNRVRPAPDWVIPNFLKRRNTAFIIGEPKRACKSWLLLEMAFNLSEGKPLWNAVHTKKGPVFPTEKPLHVVYFTQEDTEDDINDRLDKHLLRRPTNPRIHVIPKNLQNILDNGMGFNNICKEIDDSIKQSEGIPVDLVIFDPMRRMHNKEENSSDGMVTIWQQLDKIQQKYNCSVFFAHHTVKPSRSSTDSTDMTSPNAGRGSGDIVGAGDAFINVVERKNKGAQSTMHRLLSLHFETKRSEAILPIDVIVDFSTAEVVFQGYKRGPGSGDHDYLPENLTVQ